MAVVSSTTPWHQSALVGATVNSPFIPTLRVYSGEPVDDIAHRLDRFGPDVLVGYASMLRLLAGEQLAARLHIAPQVLTEEWRVFNDVLSRPEQAFASELRDTRNKWAHNEAFSPDDTYRALDSMERLLTAAGAVEQAEELRRLRLDHQRAVYETETRKAVKAAAVASVPGAGLKPWRDVISPQPDVASGQYNAAEFAADLHMVARGEGSREYVDPVEVIAY
jgi:hypothetical protein